MNKEWQTFEDICGPHMTWLYRMAFRALGNREDAETAVHETLLVTQRRLGRAKVPADFPLFLRRTLVNSCLTLLRRRRTLSDMTPVHTSSTVWIAPFAH